MFTLTSRLFRQPRVLRFGIAGLLNTAVGYAVILAALSLGYGDIVSNAMGYAAGLAFGFVLNSRWTFSRPGGVRSGAVLRYLVTFVVAYSANLMVILVSWSVGVSDNPFIHLAGICVYSLLFYAGSAYFVFVEARAIGPNSVRATDERRPL